MTTEAGGVLAGPVGVIVDLIAGLEPGMDRAAIAGVVTRVAGGRAKQRRLAQALAASPLVLADGRFPGTTGCRAAAHSPAHGRRGEHPAAGMRQVRQAPAHHAAPGPGLVLHSLLAPAQAVRILRPGPGGRHPRPAGTAAVPPVSRRR